MKYKITASISSISTCLDNAVLEYICYYHYERLHTTLGDLTPINDENLQSQVSGWAGQNKDSWTHKHKQIRIRINDATDEDVLKKELELIKVMLAKG